MRKELSVGILKEKKTENSGQSPEIIPLEGSVGTFTGETADEILKSNNKLLSFPLCKTLLQQMQE